MTVRNVLLRIVFGSLALAAGFGAAGVIFAGHDTLWRIVGTCAATAIGAFLILARIFHTWIEQRSDESVIRLVSPSHNENTTHRFFYDRL